MKNGSPLDLDRSLHLSIITQFYPPDYAATGQLIEELASQLSHQGIEVQVFTGQPGYAFQAKSAPATEKVERVLVRRSRTTQIWPQRIRGKVVSGLLFCLRSGLHLLKNSRRGNILLVTTAPPYLPVLGLFANLCFKLPYICLIYDLYPDVAIQLNVVSQKHWLAQIWHAINWAVWSRSQQIIVLSPTMKQRIADRYPALSDKISVIHSWANPNTIVPIAKQDNWFATQHHLTEKFTVLYSGNFGRCHDMETILAAADQLKNEAVQFVFIGSGAQYQGCIDQAQSLGLNNCLFLPYQDKQTLPYSLTACDLSLVSISPGMEGLVAPSKLYGTLAAGRPVAIICEPHSYLRQMLAAADCGQAFENGDGSGLAHFIRDLVQNRELSAKLGAAGRRYLLTHFTPEIIAKQYSNVIKAQTKISCPVTVKAPLSLSFKLNHSWLSRLGFSRKA
ncbi:glycosyltransferase family 4 protein [Trichocoleus sp. FACHB-591]|uniref:glycosyltransferase family 4 protein n=1 Tax=Trichocoleus sp. FACHB-591 TaxID=2692872 RepID=UPI001682353D|nr:glycosyltransferase family 4 protein [Trichocoleus sp. FACHB-591]MBD2093967.1 glycosyltransferase family 4 protein [Trichocoleus sp. FACHB-591]